MAHSLWKVYFVVGLVVSVFDSWDRNVWGTSETDH